MIDAWLPVIDKLKKTGNIEICFIFPEPSALITEDNKSDLFNIAERYVDNVVYRGYSGELYTASTLIEARNGIKFSPLDEKIYSLAVRLYKGKASKFILLKYIGKYSAPTKNRHLLLDRSLLYYVKSSIHVRIIIADSSDNALRNNTKKVFDKYSNSLNIDYFHAPENIEASTKNNIAIDMVRTPYVLNVGDDDFPLKSSIETILSKLEKDSSISAAFGDRIAITQVSNKEDNKKWINSV